MQRIIPDAVTANDNGYLLINNDPILWAMLNAIKEQQEQIEALQTETTVLRTETAALHRQNLRQQMQIKRLQKTIDD